MCVLMSVSTPPPRKQNLAIHMLEITPFEPTQCKNVLYYPDFLYKVCTHPKPALNHLHWIGQKGSKHLSYSTNGKIQQATQLLYNIQ